MGLYKVTLLGMLAYNPDLLKPDMINKRGLVLPSLHDIETYYTESALDNDQLLQILGDHESIIDTIVERNGDFPMLYADPDFFRAALYSWSMANRYKWASLAASCLYVYNPLDNYDRHTDITRSGESSSSGESVHAETAFNSGNFDGKARETSSGSSDDSETVEETVRGNVGVRSSQELIAQQREIVVFNYYDVIASDFKERWCIEYYS